MERIEISIAPSKTEEPGAMETKGFSADEESSQLEKHQKEMRPEDSAEDLNKIDDPLLRMRHQQEDRRRIVMETSMLKLDQESSQGVLRLRKHAERMHGANSSRITEQQKPESSATSDKGRWGNEEKGIEGSPIQSRLEEARRFVQEQQERRKQEHRQRMEMLRKAKKDLEDIAKEQKEEQEKES